MVANTARLVSGLGLISLLVTASAAIPPAWALDEQRIARFFGLMDEDSSGTISRPEFQRGKGVVFLAIDEDASMTITRDETRLTDEAFKTLAGDDAIIDGEEFIAADAASFDAIDKNADNAISPTELHDYVAQYSD